PEPGPGLVVVHVLGERSTRQLFPADLPQVGPVDIADELHQRSKSATAWAARPSPRPVKPSLSVVVARTLTSPPPSASESRRRISPRCAAMRGSSPTSTQSALTSVQPASVACR